MSRKFFVLLSDKDRGERTSCDSSYLLLFDSDCQPSLYNLHKRHNYSPLWGLYFRWICSKIKTATFHFHDLLKDLPAGRSRTQKTTQEN